MVEFTLWDILRNLLGAARWTVSLSLIAFIGGGLVGLRVLRQGVLEALGDADVVHDQACRLVAGKVDAPLSDLVHDPLIKEHLKKSLHAHNVQTGGSSMRIARVMLMTEPPSIDGNEHTDKGYINQRAALERRNALVERLYAENPDQDVIVVEG